MIRRSAKIALQVVAAGLAGLIVLAGVIVWQASRGPVSLSLLTPRLEAMINAGLKDFQLRFADSVLDWREGNDVAHLQFIDVEAVDKSGSVIARIPRVAVGLSGPALLRGQVAPMSVEMIGASAILVHRADRSFQLGFQTSTRTARAPSSNDAGSPGVIESVLQAMLSPKPDDTLSRYLTHFAVRDAKLTIFDEATRSYWTARGAAFAFDRAPGGIAATVKAPLMMADKTVWQVIASAIYKKDATDIQLDLALGNIALSKLATSGAGLKWLAGMDVPANGNATCNMTLKGEFGRCKLWLNVGKGVLQLPVLKSDPLSVQSAALTAEIDFPTHRYSIESLNWIGAGNKAQISGSGGFNYTAEGLPQISVDLAAEDVAIDAPNVFGGPIGIESLGIKAAYDGAASKISIESAHIRRGGFELTLAGEILQNSVNDGVKLEGTFDKLAVADLKRLWPQGMAEGARSWISENVHEGMLNDGKVTVDIPPGTEFVDGKIPDEMLNLTFNMSGTRATYLNGLPDITKVSGSGILLGDTFTATIGSGAIGDVVLKTGAVKIPELHKHASVGSISGTITGPTQAMLTVIDAPRLGYPSRFGIKPSQAGGTGEVNFTFAIPMLHDLKAEDVGINVDAEMKELKLPVMANIAITGGTMVLHIDPKTMKAHGAIFVNGAPMGITWTEDLTGTLAVGTRMDVTATLSDQNRAELGLDLRPFIEGKNTIQAIFTGRHGKITNAKIAADLTSSRLSAPQLNWAKPTGEAARMTADIAFKPDQIEITNIDAAGDNMKAVGRLAVAKGKVTAADFKTLKLGAHNDFTFAYHVDENGGRTIDAHGKVIDAGNVLDSDSSEEGSKPKGLRHTPLSVKAAFDVAHLKNEVWYQNLRVTYADNGEHLTALNISSAPDNSSIHGELTTSADGARSLKLTTGDAGKMLRGFTEFHSMVGGQLTLTADLAPLPAPGQKIQPGYDGTLKIDRFKVTNQPFLARLFAAGSFTGLGDLLQGEGVTFTHLEQRFQGRGDMLTLTEGTASGPSIGLTMQGVVNREIDSVDLNGSVVPLYGLNGMLSDFPVLGELLTSRKGEGIFGMTYNVTGHVDELKVAVNPISTLAPGILRRIFEMGPTPAVASPLPTRKPSSNAFQPQQSSGTN
ncbi:MAG: hypothetical protein GC190_09100 [Alphaproteobacteria bacterium]|nr:hypothetical protein [Alphaproteobacteria bacterium]